MIQLAIIGADGKHLSPQDLTTATELVEAVEKARTLIRECERLAQQKKSPPARQPEAVCRILLEERTKSGVANIEI